MAPTSSLRFLAAAGAAVALLLEKSQSAAKPSSDLEIARAPVKIRIQRGIRYYSLYLSISREDSLFLKTTPPGALFLR